MMDDEETIDIAALSDKELTLKIDELFQTVTRDQLLLWDLVNEREGRQNIQLKNLRNTLLRSSRSIK